MDALFSLHQRSLHASDEREIIHHALKLAVDLTDAEGSSYVPLDKHAYPLESSTYGTQPTTDLKAWVEYLASPEVHGRCQSCQKREAVDNCPLLQDPFDQRLKLYCFPLRVGEHELGVINVYLQAVEPLDDETQSFVQMMADHLAVALEGAHLKQREQNTLEQGHTPGEETDVQHMLREELRHVQTLFDTDFASLTVQGSQKGRESDVMEMGALPNHVHHKIQHIVQRVLESGEPLLLANGNHNHDQDTPDHHSIMAAPFLSGGKEVSGVLLVGKRGEKTVSLETK